MLPKVEMQTVAKNAERLQQKQTQLEEQLVAKRAEQVRELRRKHEKTLENIQEQSVEHERLLKARKEQELKQIEAQRRERSWQLESQKQQEEKRLEEEYKKQSKLRQERFDCFTAKQTEESTLAKWKILEKESLANQEINEDIKRKRQDMTQWRLQEEEDIACTSDWQRYAADKTAHIITETTNIKTGAVERIEGKRVDVAASADTRRMDLFLNAMEHSENLNEEERKQLDDILLDPSVFENQGAARTAVYQIENDRPQMLNLTSSAYNFHITTGNTGGAVVNTMTNHILFSHTTTGSAVGRSLKDEVKSKKLQADKKCDRILMKTSQKVQNIEQSEISRLNAVDRSDKRSVNLLNKVVSRGNFEPKFLTQIGQELTPIKTSLQSTTAIQDVVNVQLNDNSSSDEEYYDCSSY